MEPNQCPHVFNSERFTIHHKSSVSVCSELALAPVSSEPALTPLPESASSHPCAFLKDFQLVSCGGGL